MKVVNINEKDNFLLSNVISSIVEYYSINEKVSCIYMRCYSVYNSSNNIRVCIVYSDELEKQEIYNISGVINKLKEDTGINLSVSLCSDIDYKVDMSYSREIIACRALYNGEILFDRTGYYSWLKYELKNYQEYLTNMVLTNIKINPPLKLVKRLS